MLQHHFIDLVMMNFIIIPTFHDWWCLAFAVNFSTWTQKSSVVPTPSRAAENCTLDGEYWKFTSAGQQLGTDQWKYRRTVYQLFGCLGSDNGEDTPSRLRFQFVVALAAYYFKLFAIVNCLFNLVAGFVIFPPLLITFFSSYYKCSKQLESISIWPWSFAFGQMESAHAL